MLEQCLAGEGAGLGFLLWPQTSTRHQHLGLVRGQISAQQAEVPGQVGHGAQQGVYLDRVQHVLQFVSGWRRSSPAPCDPVVLVRRVHGRGAPALEQ